MRNIVFLLTILVTACGGYKETSGPPSSPEDLKVADMAAQLEDLAEKFQQQAPEPLKTALNEFVDSAKRFNNSSQRFGPNSLEARDAFDKIRFHSTQLDPQITQESHPDLFDNWQKIRVDYIKQITTLLGYRT